MYVYGGWQLANARIGIIASVTIILSRICLHRQIIGAESEGRGMEYWVVNEYYFTFFGHRSLTITAEVSEVVHVMA